MTTIRFFITLLLLIHLTDFLDGTVTRMCYCMPGACLKGQTQNGVCRYSQNGVESERPKCCQASGRRDCVCRLRDCLKDEYRKDTCIIKDKNGVTCCVRRNQQSSTN